MSDLLKAQRMSLTMQVEVRLKNALMTGSLRPGARLITKEIANQLGISVTPVREALLRLVSSEALFATPAQAFLVPQLSMKRYEEIADIRKQLEAMAVEAAMPMLTKEQQSLMHQRYEDFVQAKREEDIEGVLLANYRLRFQLYDFAAMPTLSGLLTQLWVRTGPCFSFLYQGPGFIDLHQQIYQTLLEALDAGDKDGVIQSIHAAIDEGTALLRNRGVLTLSDN